ncbi:MAG: 16S rRNA (cytidine(1402)-2'-O)-methyltransferase [Gammaproteobacteria bacterium]
MANGILHIVATPIGNLNDITLRALEVLRQVDLIAAEDTRHSRKLLDAYQITTRLIAVHDHNEADKAGYLCSLLGEGKNIALISDAGTPLISDPGYRLVREVRDAGFQVVTIPGACAAIAALAVAGLPTDRFLFVGFLSAKDNARRLELERLQGQTATLVLYESPKRIVELLRAVEEVMGGDRQVVLAKELTKAFETVRGGTTGELVAWLEEDEHRQRGEFVVLIHGYQESGDGTLIDAAVLRSIALAHAHMPLKKACALVSELTGLAKNQLYEAALKQIKA